MTKLNWIVVGAIAAVLLVVSLLWKHDSDKKREGRIEQLDLQHTADSVARVAAEARTDSVMRVVDSVTINSARVDTLWRTRSTTIVQNIHDIAADTSKADSTKVRQIVAKADSLKSWGDSVANANSNLRVVTAQLEVAVREERERGARERATLVTEVKELKKLSRHWGLGGSLGYAVVRVDNVIKTGPALSLGVVYRW